MCSLPFQSWVEQPSYSELPYSDINLCNQRPGGDDIMSHASGRNSERLSPKKMAIPRLAEGTEAAFTTPGRFHRRHVRRACESCRQRKTKCTGDKAGCRNCREAGIICCYTDGKREKSKRQLASLSAKVHAYEDAIKKLSARFGVSDEQLMSMALSTESFQDVSLQADDNDNGYDDRKMSWSSLSSPTSSFGGGSEMIDHTDEDFNRDDIARATGYIGKSSEIIWLQKLSKEMEQGCEPNPDDGVKFAESSLPSPSMTPRPEVHNEALVALCNYYLDDLDMPANIQFDAHHIPSRDTATKLFDAYLTSVHHSFPIIGISTFMSQFQVFFNQTSLKPGNKWLAILNLIFAIGAKYIQLTDPDRRESGEDCWKYFLKARSLSMDDQLFQYPDLQQLQVEGLASLYLLAVGHINMSWKLCGSAVRGALALGLHLRNVGSCTSDVSKEIRYRVWWSLYSLEHLLCSLTGRPTCIIDAACTTPFPVPFDEGDFQKEEVVRLIRSSSRGKIRPDRLAVCANTGNLASLDSGHNDDTTHSQEADLSKAEYLKSLPPCMSLYFVELMTLVSISKRMTDKLYSSDVAQSPWPSIQFTTQSLMLEIDSWLLNLPAPYDFTSTQTSQCPPSQRMGLAFLFYSTKIGITRPCLNRLDSSSSQGDDVHGFCNKTASECVESACQMLTLFPDTTDACTLYRVTPWWCILHFLMQAATVLLLELSFGVQHVPDKSSMVSKAAKKAVEWLYTLSASSTAAERAWKRCNSLLRRIAPSVGIDTSDLPSTVQSTAARTPADGNFEILPAMSVNASVDCIASDLDTMSSSSMQQPDASLRLPGSYGWEWPDVLDSIKPDKTLKVRDSLDDLLPYDPTTGQITGSFFPPANSTDVDLSYLWCDPLC